MARKIKFKHTGVPKGSKNALGNSGGKSLNDRKLAGAVLPRLSKVAGEDGEQLIITISKEIAEKNDIVPLLGQ